VFPRRLSHVTQRLHQLLEFFDEYENPLRGFFMTELDHNSKGHAEDHPVLVYVRGPSLNAPIPNDATPQPPDWIGEVLPDTDATSKLERYARAGVREFWRVYERGPDGGLRFEQHTGVLRDEGRYERCLVYGLTDALESDTFEGLRLRPADLLSDEPPAGAN
jgi:Uma2 family endonuclease